MIGFSYPVVPKGEARIRVQLSAVHERPHLDRAIEAFGEVQVDPARPRQAARDLGVDKNLAWRVSKIVSQPDVFQVVGNIPHQAGVKILCKAFRDAGAQADRVRNLPDAVELPADTALPPRLVQEACDVTPGHLLIGPVSGGLVRGPALRRRPFVVGRSRVGSRSP